jgi:hypothetical protein
MLSQLIAIAILAQTPQPFPKPGEPRAQTPSQRTAAEVPAQPQQTPSAQPSTAEPTEATLGVPIYPGAEFVASYDAGKGQRFYLFGTNADFSEIVNYYRTVLKQKGDLVYEEPPVQEFDIGKYREETMAFPPSVTVKDYSWGGAAGYMNPKRGKQPARFKTIIQVVPASL